MIPMQQTTVYPWDNPANYKPCKKKQYEIWVCKPPQGTVVINTLEQADAVKFAGGRTFFTAREINSDPKVAAGVQQLLQAGKAYLVKDDQTFVLCGTQGEMWCISSQKLGQKYVWASDDSIINAQTFKERAFTLSNSEKGTVTLLNWTKVRTVPDNSTAFACFVPANMQGQIQTSWAMLNINGAGVPHGKGDFVIAANANGQPNLNSRYVVNGAVFKDTYNNQGWSQCLQDDVQTHKIDGQSLPDLGFETGTARAKTYDINTPQGAYQYLRKYRLAETRSLDLDFKRVVHTAWPGFFKQNSDYIFVAAGANTDSVILLLPDFSHCCVTAPNATDKQGKVGTLPERILRGDPMKFFLQYVPKNEPVSSPSRALEYCSPDALDNNAVFAMINTYAKKQDANAIADLERYITTYTHKAPAVRDKACRTPYVLLPVANDDKLRGFIVHADLDVTIVYTEAYMTKEAQRTGASSRWDTPFDMYNYAHTEADLKRILGANLFDEIFGAGKLPIDPGIGE